MFSYNFSELQNCVENSSHTSEPILHSDSYTSILQLYEKDEASLKRKQEGVMFS